MKKLSILAVLAIASAGNAVMAQAPGGPAAKPPAPPAAAASHKIPGVSDEGNAILQKAQSAPDPLAQQLGAKARTAHDQLMSAVMAPIIDPDKVAVAMKAEGDALAQIREHNNDRLIAVLKLLPSDDRGTFLRTLVLSRQRPAAPANPPAATPKP